MNPINPNNFLDITKATAQEVFDFAVNHLRTQKTESVNSNGACVYKGPNGLMCGAAPFIQNYNPEMEGSGYEDIPNQPANHRQLICDIQEIHDIYVPTSWEDGFKLLASDFNLQYTAPRTQSP